MNYTTYYNFPLFEETDHPSWLTDWNNTVEHIDGVLEELKLKEEKNTGDILTNGTAIAKLKADTATLSVLINDITEQLTETNAELLHTNNSVSEIKDALITANAEIKNIAVRLSKLEVSYRGTVEDLNQTKIMVSHISETLTTINTTLSSLDLKVLSVESKLNHYTDEVLPDYIINNYGHTISQTGHAIANLFDSLIYHYLSSARLVSGNNFNVGDICYTFTKTDTISPLYKIDAYVPRNNEYLDTYIHIARFYKCKVAHRVTLDYGSYPTIAEDGGDTNWEEVTSLINYFKELIPDVSNFITKQNIDNYLPDMSDYAYSTDVENLQQEIDNANESIVDLANLQGTSSLVLAANTAINNEVEKTRLRLSVENIGSLPHVNFTNQSTDGKLLSTDISDYIHGNTTQSLFKPYELRMYYNYTGDDRLISPIERPDFYLELFKAKYTPLNKPKRNDADKIIHLYASNIYCVQYATGEFNIIYHFDLPYYTYDEMSQYHSIFITSNYDAQYYNVYNLEYKQILNYTYKYSNASSIAFTKIGI